MSEEAPPLVQAAFRGDIQAVDRQLDSGADIDAAGRVWNPLHAAIESEELECVRLLLERGADVEAISGDLSPLAHAVDITIDGHHQSGGIPGGEHLDIVALLLHAGADPEPGLRVAEGYEATRVVHFISEVARRPRPAFHVDDRGL